MKVASPGDPRLDPSPALLTTMEQALKCAPATTRGPSCEPPAALRKDQMFSFALERQPWWILLASSAPKRLPSQQRDVEPERRGVPSTAAVPLAPTPWGARSPPRRKIRGSGPPGPHYTRGETEAQRGKGSYLLMANRTPCRAGPQPRRLSSVPQGSQDRLRSAKAGLPSPFSSSGPFSRHLGDAPEFIDRQGSLESIRRTLLINLFQIIAENY